MKKIIYILVILLITMFICIETVVAPIEIKSKEVVESIEYNNEEKNILEPQIEKVEIETETEEISEVVKSFEYIAPVSGIAGKATLLNLLATAFEPVGTTLYIYGGGWNYENTGGSEFTNSIGISQTWVDFFQHEDANYLYRDDKNKSSSYYPYNGKNTYYELGLDCSAYIGWVVYNTLHSGNFEADYVVSSTSMAKSLSEKGFGIWTNKLVLQSDLQVGDIFSKQGHVWLVLGICDDESVLILHSTPSESINGFGGGGVQLSAIGQDINCDAYILANEYMTKYYPEWSSRYKVILKSYSDCGYLGSSNISGRFSWDIDGVLLDPEGVGKMSAEEILNLLFNKNDI